MSTAKGPRLIFEMPSKKEKTWIHRGLARYLQPNRVKTLLQDRHLFIGRGRRKEVYLVSASLWRIYQLTQSHRHPYFLGLYLGDLQGDILVPSLHVLPFLATHVSKDAVVRVTAEGEQHFLYGRHLDTNHLHPFSPTVKEGGDVIVVNTDGEGLGYGKLQREGGKQGKLINQKDLGWYLRRGK